MTLAQGGVCNSLHVGRGCETVIFEVFYIVDGKFEWLIPIVDVLPNEVQVPEFRGSRGPLADAGALPIEC